MNLPINISQLPFGGRQERRSQFIIYDGVYEDAQAIRSFALDKGFRDSDSGSYAGRNGTERNIEPSIVSLFSHLVGSKITIASSDAFGVFRNSKKGEAAKTYIHTDPVTWGGVIYLNEPDNCIGGTGFWRHKETGLEEFPWSDYAQYGFKSVNEAWLKFVVEDGNNQDLWDLVFVCPARFNRLVLFNSRLFHSHLPQQNFGETNQTARLVQVFFFEPKDKD